MVNVQHLDFGGVEMSMATVSSVPTGDDGMDEGAAGHSMEL